MAQTVTISTKTIDKILTRLDELTKEIRAIKERLLAERPLYGSNAWWEKEIKEAQQEIKEGKGTVIHNKKDLNSFFKRL